MSRRVNLPGADELFRATVAVPIAADADSDQAPDQPRSPSGRVKHEAKITVYVTYDELLDIEHARLTLRRTHRIGVDRGRLIREAVALVLADLEEHGEHHPLISRLQAS